MNWRDPFGKKRIKELEIENSKLRKDYDELKEFYDEQARYVVLKKSFNVRKYTSKVYDTDRYGGRTIEEKDDYIKHELITKLAHALKDEVSYLCGWDEKSGYRVWTATIEVLAGKSE